MIESGIDWIGTIPESWGKVKFNAVYGNRNTKVSDKEYQPLSVTKKGIVSRLESAAKTNDSDNRKLVKAGDFVINSRSDRRGSCGISPLDGSVSLINTVLEPLSTQIVPLYFDFLFHTVQFADEFYKWGHGIVDDLWTTNWNDMKNITLILPPKSVQKHIAEYLGKKTSKIDSLINKINEEIELLQQYQNSVITKMVTKGLDPNVPMKDSGIKWIGKVPQNWKIEKIKYRSKEVSRKKRLSDLDFNYIGLENVEKANGKYVNTDTKYPDDYYDSCKTGDVLYAKLRPNLAKVLIAPFDSCCSGEFEIVSGTNIENKYLFYFLLSDVVTKSASMAIYGAKMPRVSWNFISNLKICFPDRNTQKTICNFLDEEVSKIQKLINKKNEQINQLQEYKNSMIFEYVTGKREVPMAKEMN